MGKDFDKKKLYEEEIAPLAQELLQKCNENKIPYFVAFGVKMKNGLFKKGEGIECTCLLPEVLSIDTNDSFFADFVNILNGARTTYSKPEEVDVDDEETEFG